MKLCRAGRRRQMRNLHKADIAGNHAICRAEAHVLRRDASRIHYLPNARPDTVAQAAVISVDSRVADASFIAGLSERLPGLI